MHIIQQVAGWELDPAALCLAHQQVDEQVYQQVRQQVHRQVREQVQRQVQHRVWQQILYPVREQTRELAQTWW